jgi:hypothetical protein
MNQNFKYENKEIEFREDLKSTIVIKLKKLLDDIALNPSMTERIKICVTLFREINKYQDDFKMILHYYRSFIYLFIVIKYKIYELMEQYHSGYFENTNKRLMKSFIMEISITETFIKNILTHYIQNYGNIRETRNYTYVYHNDSALFYTKKRDNKTGKWVKHNSAPLKNTKLQSKNNLLFSRL